METTVFSNVVLYFTVYIVFYFSSIWNVWCFKKKNCFRYNPADAGQCSGSSPVCPSEGASKYLQRLYTRVVMPQGRNSWLVSEIVIVFCCWAPVVVSANPRNVRGSLPGGSAAGQREYHSYYSRVCLTLWRKLMVGYSKSKTPLIKLFKGIILM